MSDPIATSVWARPRRPQNSQPALSRDQILAAALEMLDAEGIEGLTMRRLGAKLGAGATSIYWHVAHKDELLELAINEVMGEIELPDGPDVTWRTAAKALAIGVRSMILRHPWIISLSGARPNIGPNAMRLSDRTLAILIAEGFEGVPAGYVASLLMSHAIGAATVEAAWRTAVRRSGLTAEDLTRSFNEYQELVGADYPTYRGWMREVAALDIGRAQEDSFAYGLECLLDGVESRLHGDQK
jgi:AcrR family transcriptional regulator